MAVARFGALFAFAAFVLLLLCTLSTPIIDSITFMHADINGGLLRLGTYGYCYGGRCTSKEFGYQIDDLLDATTGNTENIRGNIQKGLTYAAGVINPASAGLAFIATLFAIGGNVISHILGSIVAFFAFLVAVVGLGVNLGLYVEARHRLNDAYPGDPAELGNAMWMYLAGTIALLIAAFTVCCGGIRDKRSKHAYDSSYNNTSAPVTSERPSRFNFFRRNRY